jgi:chitinase
MKTLRKNYTTTNGYETYWDNEAKAPYKYNSGKKVYLTYDDERSVAAKAAYVKEKGLGGIMFWELRQDIIKNGLIDKIYESLNK